MRQAGGTPTWRFSLVCVIGLQLLTTAGTWWITDHGEILAVADRFLTAGRMDLRDLPPGFASWTRIAAERHNWETRFLPGSILSLVPFLAIDRLLGWTELAQFRVVHLQGHVLVGLSLFFAGLAVFRSTRSHQMATLAVLLSGFSWPVWMIARRLGPEPVLMLLVTLFITGGVRTRSACLFALPWVHPSGLLLGLGLMTVLAFEKPGTSAWLIPGAGLVGGMMTVALLWNLPTHGNFVAGGYERYAADRFFELRNPLVGMASQLSIIVLSTVPVWLFGLAAPRGRIARCITLALPSLVFFGTFSNTEVTRRFAPLVAAWVILLSEGAATQSFARVASLAGMAFGSGVIGLAMDFVSSVATPWGTFNGPHLLLISLAFVEHQPALAAALSALLTALTARGAQQALRAMRDEDPGPQ